MATPLAQLVHDVVHDPEVRAQFAAAPESFLADHGHEQLAAADIREAFFVLADGSAPDAAVTYQSGGQAIADDDLDGSAAEGLSGALAAILGSVFGVELGADPALLDGTSDLDAGDDDAADASTDDGDADGSDDTDNADAEIDGGAVDRSGIAYADDVDQPRDAGGLDDLADDFDPSATGTAAGAGVATGVDVLDGLPDIEVSVLDESTLVRDPEPVADDGDGWDDVI